MSLCFEAKILGGVLGSSNETINVRYFLIEEMESLDVWEDHKLRIDDALAVVSETFAW